VERLAAGGYKLEQ